MVKKCMRLFWTALAALGLSSISLFLIPLIEGNKPIQYALAACFWLFLLTELILLGIGNQVRKKIEQFSPHMKCQRGAGRIGLLCFAQNREAIVFDILFVISILYIVTISLLRVDSVWLILIGILATYVSFHLHCILNGILYKSIKSSLRVIHKRRERK